MNLKRILFTVIIVVLVLFAEGQQKYAIVVHGGAGVMSKEKMTKEQQNDYKAKINEALDRMEKEFHDELFQLMSEKMA